MADYSFPFQAAKSLIACCFTGTLGLKVNNLQKELQQTRVSECHNETAKVKDLNKGESEYWLYIKVIELLGNAKPESNKRIAKTLEALEFQRTKILEQLEPHRPKRYRTLSKIQNFARSLFQSQLEKDYLQLEKLINNLLISVTSSQPSPTAFQELLDSIAREIDRNSAKINPSRLRLIYKLENIIKAALLNNELYAADKIETNPPNISFVNDLQSQIEILTEAVNKKFVENREQQEELNRQSEKIKNLNRAAAEREAETNNFRQQIEALRADNSHKKYLLDRKNEELVKSKDREFDLDAQISTLRKQLELLQEKYNKQTLSNLEADPSNTLKEMLIQRGLLKGPYIGNLSEPKTKYHFDPQCPDWKSLVLEYLFVENKERKVKNSHSSDIFLRAKLEKCSKCKEC